MVATSLAQLFSRIDVATLVSRRNLVVVPFCYNSESRLQFLAILHVATSVLGCDHISVSIASPQVVTFFLSSALLCSEFRLRPQLLVATAFDSLLTFKQVVTSRYSFLVAGCLSCFKHNFDLDVDAQCVFRSRPQ